MAEFTSKTASAAGKASKRGRDPFSKKSIRDHISEQDEIDLIEMVKHEAIVNKNLKAAEILINKIWKNPPQEMDVNTQVSTIQVVRE